MRMTSLGDRLSALLATPGARLLTALLISLVPAIIVYRIGWISDDAFITFRYASNVLSGHGPVFNVGEHVQGYTHPLWLAFLTAGLFVIENPLYVSIGLGVGLTVIAVTLAAYGIISLSANRLLGVLIAGGLALVLISSESWLSFQTSGLENSLSHVWIVLLVLLAFYRPTGAYLLLSGLISLAWLTRPDLAPLLIPMAAVCLYQAYDERRLAVALAGFLPALAWLGFAQLYYGEFLPNTSDVKVGMFPSLWASIEQGLRYAQDWVRHEPLPAAAAVAALIAAIFYSRGLRQYAITAGAALYLLYVIFVGGDFMRGRFLMSFFVATTTLAGFLLATRMTAQPLPLRNLSFAAVGSAAVVLLFIYARPPVNAEVSQYGIGNERAFYSGMSLESYQENGEITYPFYELAWIRELAQYAEVCGSLTMHTATVGAIGYYAGDKVTIIDTIGLNDDFIAGLPRENLIAPPRVGHPLKYIPISYLAGRDDISILQGWEEAIRERDCDFEDRLAPLESSRLLYHPFQPIPPPEP